MKKAAAKIGAKSKGAAPKRVTNAQMMEQMEIMMAQMKSLVVRTEVLEQSKVSGAKAAQELGGGSISGVPAVSAGMPLMSGPPATAFAKYTALVGPPPKVKMATPVAPVASPQVPAEAQGSEDPPVLLMP